MKKRKSACSDEALFSVPTFMRKIDAILCQVLLALTCRPDLLGEEAIAAIAEIAVQPRVSSLSGWCTSGAWFVSALVGQSSDSARAFIDRIKS
jgi:hypothetical protein